jgi:hypothetical protein
MSDFVIRKKEELTSITKSLSILKASKKEVSVILKIVVFIAFFSGLIYLSISRNNLMLSEILTVGGITSIVFFIHILSDK